MNEPDAPDESVRQRWPATPEMSDADVADQRREVAEDPPPVLTADLPLEADPADAVDQQRVVTGLDEEFR